MDVAVIFELLLSMAKQEKSIVPKITAAFMLVGMFMFSGCSSLSSSSYRQGKAAATRDLNDGILAVETYGFTMGGSDLKSQLLKERYNIERRIVAGCIVSKKIRNHAKGYNGVSLPEIERRFGKDIGKKVHEEARHLSESKEPRAPQAVSGN